MNRYETKWLIRCLLPLLIGAVILGTLCITKNCDIPSYANNQAITVWTQIVHVPVSVEPFKSPHEMYDFVLDCEVPFRFYEFGVYDCINYDFIERVNHGFTIDFIEEARSKGRLFLTDKKKISANRFHLYILGFVGNEIYEMDLQNLAKQPTLVGKCD